jgi:hypothetical protein
MGTRAVICMHLCLCKTLSQDCPHGEIRQSEPTLCHKDPQNSKQHLTKMHGFLKKEATFLENLQK